MSEILQEQIRFLRFQSIQPRLREHPRAYFIYAIIATALAGIGRHWDKPDAFLFDRLGLSSVVYIFVLGTILWLFALPMRPKNWSLFSILIFMGFCGPCAYIYAIPVEMVFNESVSGGINLGLLAIVAIWRVKLYWKHVRVVGALEKTKAFCAVFTPISIILIILGYFGLIFGVMLGMGGIEESEVSADAVYYAPIFFFLGLLALPIAAASIIAYCRFLFIDFSEWLNRNAKEQAAK